MFVSRGSRSCDSREAGKAVSAAPKGNQRARVCRDLACLRTLAPVGSEACGHLACGRPSSGLLVFSCYNRGTICSLPPPKVGNGEKRKNKHQGPRQVNSSTSQPWTRVPAQEGPRGPGAGGAGKARHRVDGVGTRRRGRCCRRQVQRWGRSPERHPLAPPGLPRALEARASSRPSQAPQRRRGRERGCGGSSTGMGAGGGDLPVTRRQRRIERAAPGWRPRPPRLSGFTRCSLQPARLAPTPAPEDRYLGTLAPRSLPAAIRASLLLPHPTSASAEGEGRGREEQEPALPAAVAASRNSSRRNPCAPQRSAAAGGSGRPRIRASARG